jgi:hypothetical protein
MAGSGSWTAVQATDIATRLEDALAQAREALGPGLVAEVLIGERLALDAGQVERTKQAVAVVGELAERLVELTDALPCDGLVVGDEDAAVGAGSDLLDGIVEGSRAELAARMLALVPGCLMFAEALRSDESPRGWDDIPVDRLLAGFRDSDEHVAAGLLLRAGIAPETTFADASVAQIARLAGVLEQFAAEPQR